MKKLQYSPDAREKMMQIKLYVTQNFGEKKAAVVIKRLTDAIRGLQKFEKKGVSVEQLLGIVCDYRVLIVQQNYVFYRIEADAIKIIDIYNEKEDFMWKLFGIRTTTDETEEYWDE